MTIHHTLAIRGAAWVAALALAGCGGRAQAPGLAGQQAVPRYGAPLQRPHLRDLLQHDPRGSAIRVAAHCYGCTAGKGSSCGGALEH